MPTFSGKCGRCGYRLYVGFVTDPEAEGSVSEQAKTSCPSCGEQLQVRVGGLAKRHKPDPPGPLQEALAVAGIAPNVQGQAQPVLGVRQATDTSVLDRVTIPTRDAQTGQILDVDQRQAPEERS